MTRTLFVLLFCSALVAELFIPRDAAAADPQRIEPAAKNLLATEKLDGEGVWVQPILAKQKGGNRLRVKVWFDEQFLGNGTAYRRRAKEFADSRRGELRTAVIKTLKALNEKSYTAAEEQLDKLTEQGKVSDIERHWIINGFTCNVSPEGLEALKSVKGVKQIYSGGRAGRGRAGGGKATTFEPVEKSKFDPNRYKHPWYIRHLQADKVWKKFNVAGQGTLNVVHDFNFVYSDNVSGNLYRNPGEIPGNGKDDDGNGLVDDYHGYNFDVGTPNVTTRPVPLTVAQPQSMHGFMCAAIICGAGTEGKEYEFGIAPQASWTGLIGSRRLEAAVEWAVEQGADTYSMSFSIPGLGDYRSHWRKIMEHGSFCGVYFVSGAGNFGQKGSRSYAPVPVQMRTPEDIPDVVFAAAGVKRDFSRTPFSSQGPVKWDTNHYKDWLIQKPEVCAFNSGLPFLLRDGSVRTSGLNGNSFAGPMFCGSIALMLSADPDLLPWDLKKIITTTATDVGPEGVDSQTGHGLINCYRAVKEVLRRKAIREGKDPKPYEGREKGDTLNVAELQKQLQMTKLTVAQLEPRGQAARRGLKVGDIIISYGGNKVNSRQDLIAAKQKIDDAEPEFVPVVVQRDGKNLDFKFKPGPLGVVPGVETTEPVFR